MATLFYMFLFCVVMIISLIVGFGLGKSHERKIWHTLRKVAIPGQRLWVRGIGEVFILDYSADEQYVNIIPEIFLEGKWPTEFPEDEINKNVISIGVDQFLTQVTFDSVKQAAKI